jgi:hypothetical protein
MEDEMEGEKVKQLMSAQPGWVSRSEITGHIESVVMWALMEDGQIVPVIYEAASRKMVLANADTDVLLPSGAP